MGRASGEVLVARWRDRIARQRRSVWTVSEFCRREGVSKASFYEWRRRLASRDSVERASPARERSADRPNLTASRAAGFIELPAAAWPASDDIRIVLPSGATVALPAHVSADLITAAIRAALSPAEDRPC